MMDDVFGARARAGGAMTPTLRAVAVPDPAERWSALGFEVIAGAVLLPGVRVVLDAPRIAVAIDGSRRSPRRARAASPPAGAPVPAPIRTARSASTTSSRVTPEFDATAAALESAGLALRRVRDAGGFRQGFRRLGGPILELVEASQAPATGLVGSDDHGRGPRCASPPIWSAAQAGRPARAADRHGALAGDAAGVHDARGTAPLGAPRELKPFSPGGKRHQLAAEPVKTRRIDQPLGTGSRVATLALWCRFPLSAPARATGFSAAFDEPTPAQAQAWPAIASGEHVLISAPTGSGKTLAAFLWGIDRLADAAADAASPASGSSTSPR